MQNETEQLTAIAVEVLKGRLANPAYVDETEDHQVRTAFSYAKNVMDEKRKRQESPSTNTHIVEMPGSSKCRER